MRYYNIKSIDIKDFRCLEEVHLDFTESPIICLQAGNDGGKSSIVKAIQTAIYNDNQRKSKGYIRTGSNGFKISIEFMDGTRIERERGTIGNVYRLFNPDGTLHSEYSKLDKACIPPQIEEILNVFMDDTTGELLNIRTCESLVLFALTKGSENYKIMHAGLKVDQVSNALILGKERVNQLYAAKNNCCATIDGYEEQIRKIVIPDLTPVEQLKERISKTAETLGELKNIIIKRNERNILWASLSETETAIANLQPVGEDTATTLEKLQFVVQTISNVRVIKEELARLSSDEVADDISYDKFNAMNELENIIKLRDNLNTLKEEARKVNMEELSSLEDIDGEKVDLLGDIIHSIKACGETKSLLKQAEDELEELQRKLDEAIKSSGMYYDINDNSVVSKCGHCGEENRLALDDIVRACEIVK